MITQAAFGWHFVGQCQREFGSWPLPDHRDVRLAAFDDRNGLAASDRLAEVTGERDHASRNCGRDDLRSLWVALDDRGQLDRPGPARKDPAVEQCRVVGPGKARVVEVERDDVRRMAEAIGAWRCNTFAAVTFKCFKQSLCNRMIRNAQAHSVLSTCNKILCKCATFKNQSHRTRPISPR